MAHTCRVGGWEESLSALPRSLFKQAPRHSTGTHRHDAELPWLLHAALPQAAAGLVAARRPPAAPFPARGRVVALLSPLPPMDQGATMPGVVGTSSLIFQAEHAGDFMLSSSPSGKPPRLCHAHLRRSRAAAVRREGLFKGMRRREDVNSGKAASCKDKCPFGTCKSRKFSASPARWTCRGGRHRQTEPE